MRLLTNTIMIIVLLYAGAYIGHDRMNKAVVVSAKKVVEMSKSAFSYIREHKEEEK